MKPTWDDLASVILTIQGYWAEVVNLIARAVELTNQLGFSSSKVRLKNELSEVNDDIEKGPKVRVLGIDTGFRTPASGTLLTELKARRDRIVAQLDEFEGSPDERRREHNRGNYGVTRGAGAVPTLKKQGGEDESRDQFEVAVDSITKHIATLNADTAAVFQNNAAKAQLRAEFQLLTAIMRDEGEVTQEQIDKYEELRKTMSAQQALTAAGIKLEDEHAAKFELVSNKVGQATAAYGAANQALERLNSASQQLGSALSTAFSNAVIEGKKFSEVMSSLLKTLGNALINSGFASIFNAPSTGGTSLFGGWLKSIFGFAEGTDFAPGGMAIVGERGPELVNLPRGAQVIPNHILNSRSDAMSFTYAPSYDARGASVEAVARLEQMMARDRAEFSSKVVATVRKARDTRSL
jgi:hypothetical protein